MKTLGVRVSAVPHFTFTGMVNVYVIVYRHLLWATCAKATASTLCVRKYTEENVILESILHLPRCIDCE